MIKNPTKGSSNEDKKQDKHKVDANQNSDDKKNNQNKSSKNETVVSKINGDAKKKTK